MANHTNSDEVINISRLIEFSGNDIQFQRDMLSLFQKQSKEVLASLKKQIREADYKSVAREAHKLKSSFGVLGCNTEFLEILEKLQVSSNHGINIDKIIYALEEQLNRINNEIYVLLDYLK